MATLDTLCQVTSIKTGQQLYIVAEGLSSGSTYTFARDAGGVDDNLIGTAVADSDGIAASAQISGIAQSWAIWLHTGSSVTHATRIATAGAPYTVLWTSGGSAQVYGSIPVLSGTPGNTTADLSWTAGVGCDARIVSVKYTLARSTTGPSSGFSNVSGAVDITGTSFTDTGLTNGTTYWYRVTTTYAYLGTGSGKITFTAAASNVVSVVPSVSTSVEVWGSIPQ